jgi:hydroxypyruvate isomerase
MTANRRTFLGASAAATAAGIITVPAVAAAPQERQPNQNQPNEELSRLGRTQHTRFAVNVEMWWGRMPFIARLEQAARLGFPAVEFWPWRNKDIKAVAQTCQKLKLDVAQFTAWGFTPGLNDPRNHDRFVKEIRDSIETARRLNCQLMTVVAGNDIAGMTQQQMHQNVITGLRRVAEMCEKAKVTLILEPMNIRVDHKGHCLYGSEPTLRIIKAVNSPAVKINWDLYHMQITEGDLCGHLREGFAARAIGYIQLADHPGRNEPGTGEINYTRVLREIRDQGYRGYVGLELRPRKDEVTAARAVNRADQW